MIDYTGEYYLNGVMETAAGFNIQAAYTFEFFFMYGALDRSARGSWKEVSPGIIELTSTAPRLPSFSIKNESKASHNNIELQIENFQQPLLRYTQIAAVPGNEAGVEADTKGIFIFPAGIIDKFIVTCYMYADNPAVVVPAHSSSNHFLLQVNPSIIEVQFQGLRLELEGKTLRGRLPGILDPEKVFTFEK